ncbi:MAG: NUDIX hydrolase [Rhodospirillaceae bacterium]|nr:NUDIX hydrolase [Rhodospirillaceae bacterium]
MSNPNPHPTVGVGVVVLKGDDVLLIRRGRPPKQGEWSIPGGRQEFGETVRACALREVLEETGITAGNLALIDVVDLIRPATSASSAGHWTLVDFAADWVSGEPTAGDDAADARWVKCSDIESLGLWRETVRIIRAAMDMKTHPKSRA